jgi:methyltransferase
MHPDLRHAALLKSMDLPHHLRADDRLPFREGVTIPFPTAKKGMKGTLVDVGMGQVLLPNDNIKPYTRVTLDMSLVTDKSTSGYLTNAKLAAPTDPTTQQGYYWGYNTRQASSLSAVITESPYENGYDFVIGTSERGVPLTQTLLSSLPRFSHLLIVLGGQCGIEAAADNDSALPLEGRNVSELFDWWINCVPGQGSRTIRTEEAIWIVLAQVFGEIQQKGIK